MKKLIEIALKQAGEAEVYGFKSAVNSVHLQNHSIQSMDNSIQNGYCLRVIGDGHIGTAYTRNLTDREGLVRNAMISLKGGIRADFHFPSSFKPRTLTTYDESIESLGMQQVLVQAQELSRELQGRIPADCSVMVAGGFSSGQLSIMNSAGLSVTQKSSSFSLSPWMCFPNTYTGVGYSKPLFGYKQFDMSDLSESLELFSKGYKEISVPSGRVPVIFDPQAIHVLTWRFLAGTSAKAVYEKTSPVAGKSGQRIFSERLTIIDNPHDDEYPGARVFDDEGVETGRTMLVENGYLRGFFNSLEYAAKLGTKPTGNGYKATMMGDGELQDKPTPNLLHLQIKPGTDTLQGMIRNMKRGIILCGSLGAHSGNIPNGDFNIGLSPGLYVENGEIIGRVKDGMIAGNIYDMMKNVSGVEDKLRPAWAGKFPYICFDDVMMSVK